MRKKIRKIFQIKSTTKADLIDAFSLAEILIVLAIMGILIMLVVPNQAGVASRTKSIEAQQELKMIQNLEYAYFLQYSKYTTELTAINYLPQKLVTNGGTANYQIQIVEATIEGFTAKAEAVVDFNGDGKMNIWQIDQDGILKEIQPD
jgi:type IV pilus assembly protein PilE